MKAIKYITITLFAIVAVLWVVLLSGCKEQKEPRKYISPLYLTDGKISSDTLYLDTTKSKAGYYTPTGLYVVGIEPRMKSAWLPGKEYDRPKKRKKKERKFVWWGTETKEFNAVYNLNYRDTAGGMYYDSSYTITWDSSGHQFGGGIQAVPPKYKNKDKDIYKHPDGLGWYEAPYLDSGYNGAGFSTKGAIILEDPTVDIKHAKVYYTTSDLFYHCLLMDNATGLVILDTLINKYEFNAFFNYHKTHQ